MKPSLLAVVVLLGACGSNNGGPPMNDVDAMQMMNGADAMPDASSIPAPTITGEASAGHLRPTWLWSGPAGAEAYRYRIDGGAFTEVAASVTRFTATTDLAEGARLFEVQARIGGIWGAPGMFQTTIEIFGSGAWVGFQRAHATPFARRASVICRNCYDTLMATSEANLAQTLVKIHDAQDDGADGIELDVRVEGGIWYVSSMDNGATTPARLDGVLADAALRSGDQALFLEIRESTPQTAEMQALLDMVVAGGFPRNGRPVVFSALDTNTTALTLLKGMVEPDDLPFQHAYFRFHLYYSSVNDWTSALLDQLTAAKTAGWDGIQILGNGHNALNALRHARQQGLAVGITEVFLTNQCLILREMIDFAVAGRPDLCGPAVTAQTNLVYLDVAGQDSAGTTTTYYRADAAPFNVATGGTGAQPIFVADPPGGESLGTTLRFLPGESDALALYDADNPAAGGYQVAMFVRFETLVIGEGTTRTLLSKGEADSGFTLELHRPVSSATVLRFGVYVGSQYHYATFSTGALVVGEWYLVGGEYNGQGNAAISVDLAAGTLSPAVNGGIVQNDTPITVGADPQGTGTPQLFWDGEVQMVQVHRWPAP